MKDITWGQYHSVDSMIHRIDPRVKIRFTIIYIILLLLDRNLPLFLFLTTVFAGVWASSRVPMRKMIRGTKGVFIFILICSILNAFTMHGTTLVKLGVLTITKEGLIKAGFVFWRMLLLILMSSLLMYTTTPTRLTDGMEKCMHLSGGVAMGITIALRFVPILFGELDRIMKAQMARGANFEEGNIIQKAKAMVPVVRLKKLRTVILPLFQNAISRAGHLGDAMDSRCYTGGKGRTKLHPLVYERRDMVAYVCMLAIVIASVVLIVKF